MTAPAAYHFESAFGNLVAGKSIVPSFLDLPRIASNGPRQADDIGDAEYSDPMYAPRDNKPGVNPSWTKDHGGKHPKTSRLTKVRARNVGLSDIDTATEKSLGTILEKATKPRKAIMETWERTDVDPSCGKKTKTFYFVFKMYSTRAHMDAALSYESRNGPPMVFPVGGLDLMKQWLNMKEVAANRKVVEGFR